VERSDYEQGFVDGVRAYAYTSSEPWAENGVQYVGTTGRTLAEAIEHVRETSTFTPPTPPVDTDGVPLPAGEPLWWSGTLVTDGSPMTIEVPLDSLPADRHVAVVLLSIAKED
jgi:hypothetical protein